MRTHTREQREEIVLIMVQKTPKHDPKQVKNTDNAGKTLEETTDEMGVMDCIRRRWNSRHGEQPNNK